MLTTKSTEVIDLVLKRKLGFVQLIKNICFRITEPGRVAQSVARLTQEPEVSGSMSGPATYFRFRFRCFKKGNCQLPAKVCVLNTD